MICDGNFFLNYLEDYKKIEKEILPFVEHPSRYIGIEFKKYLKDIKKTKVKICLVFPDLYEIGMSSLGIKILFHYLNRFDDILVDMAFMPKKDFADKLKENSLELYSLGYKIPLKKFDIIGFSLNYELCYTNVLSILDYSNIPIHSKNRKKDFPIIIAGGCCTSNPAPMSKFIDVFVIGDGEDILLKICNLMSIETKSSFLCNKTNILKKLSKESCLYIPLFSDSNKKIKPDVIKDLNKNYFPDDMIMPLVNIVHQHLSIEIQRGCFRSCKFCHASFINRPVRIKSFDTIKNLIKKSIKNSGLNDVSLLSLSVVDHPDIKKILQWFIKNYYSKHYSISLPSLRCDKFSLNLAELVNKNKKSSLTFAPEAGSQKLRDIIGKNISEEDIFTAVSGAYEKGWKLVKLYFMYGLPFETMQDIEDMVSLVKRLKNSFKGLKFNIGISSFVPKPHTPFAYQKQQGLEELLAKKKYIIDNLKKIAKVKHSKLESSIVEGLFARGDEKVGDIIENAWKSGASFDQWEEHFNYKLWEDAVKKEGLDIEKYVTRDIDFEKNQAWEIIDYGIPKDTLLRMSKKIYTTKKNQKKVEQKKSFLVKQNKNIIQTKEIKPIFRYRAKYEKGYDIRYLSHLEVVELLKSLLVCSKLPVAFSEGFHPLPKISCNSPLSVGFSGESEWFDFEINKNFDIDYLKRKLNKFDYLGLKIKEIRKIELNTISLDKILKLMEYEIILPDKICWDKYKIKNFLESKKFVVTISSNKKKYRVAVTKNREIDLKKIIYNLKLINEKTINIIINTNHSYIGISKIIKKLFELDEEILKQSLITRKRFWLGNGVGGIIEP